ncbi:MAG: ATP-binding protein, partial [Bacteroidota bacterium]
VRFENEVRSIAADIKNPDILWLAGTDGLYRFDTRTHIFQHFENKKNGVAEWLDNSFHFVYPQTDHDIWMGTWGGGLVHFDPANNQFSNRPHNLTGYAQKNLSANVISNILSASDSSLYISTLDAGLLEYFPSENRYEKKLPDGNKKEESIFFTGITRTSDGSTWFCSNDMLYQQHPLYKRFGEYQSFFQPEGKFVYKPSLSSVIYLPSVGQYWMSCNAGYGIYVYDQQFRYLYSVSVESPSYDKQFRDLAMDGSGRIWLMSLDAPYLYLYDSGKKMFLHYKRPVSMKSILDLRADINGDIWIMTPDGLWKMNHRNMEWNFYPVNPKHSIDKNILFRWAQIRFDKQGNPWVGTDQGLWQYKSATKEWNSFQLKEGKEYGLAANAISAFTFDKKGMCWLAPLDEGLQPFDPFTGIFKEPYSFANGFFSQRVNTIVTDAAGMIWGGTINGLFRFNPMQKKWVSFNRQDGLPKDYIDLPLFAFENGEVILSVDHGFTHWNINHIPSNTQRPIVYFDQYSSDGKKLTPLRGELRLAGDMGELTISFGAIAPVMNNRLLFAYRLLPGQQQWTTTNDRRISFAGLGHGTYTLQLKAIHSDGVESELKELKLFVPTPVWMRWWFVLLMLTIMASIFYIVYRYRLQQALKLHELRNSISRDLHDEIGSSVSSVNMLATVAKQQLGEAHAVTPLLEQIGQSALTAGESMDEIIWSVNPKHDGAEDTFIRLRKYISEQLETHQIDYAIHFPEADAGWKMNMQLRRDLWMICKEAVNNSIKYAKCDKLTIEIKRINGMMEGLISDDGIGFDLVAAEHKKRNGLRNMKERVAKYKRGRFEVKTEKGRGTQLFFYLPE